MSEVIHARHRTTLIRIGIGVGLMLSSVSTPVSAGIKTPSELPGCGFRPAVAAAAPAHDWSVRLGRDGTVAGHELTLPGTGRLLRLGRRAFARPVGNGRVLIGQRSHGQTHLSMIDGAWACRIWDRRVSGLAFPLPASGADPDVTLQLVEPESRESGAALRLDIETGASYAMVDGTCPGSCDGDDEVALAQLLPAGADRPVPSFPAGAWPRDKRLSFRWPSTAVPPSWARNALKAAASDATDSSFARSPRFMHDQGASNSVRYTGNFPSFCQRGIGCAQRIMSAGWWSTWLRPQGTEFSWGTLRWCQKNEHASCFDIRRVLLHELGHVSGLNHPETQGSRMSPFKSIMSAITPTKRSPGGSRHRYGSCDVATLQEMYDVPSRKTLISRCNDVATSLRFWSDKDVITRGDTVRLKAELRIDDRAAYGLLRGNPLDDRAVRLRFRKAGSDDEWTTAWMKPRTKPGRYELSMNPSGTWEYRAVFVAPDAEGLNTSRSVIRKVKVNAA